MMQLTKRTIRIWWAVLFLILLAALLPGVIGHPYPRSIGPYIGYGGILLYAVGAISLVIIVGRMQKRPSNARDKRP